VTNQSTIIFNKELGINTYRPFLVRRDSETGKERMSINSLGLRSPEIGDRTANEIRLAVVGASTVAGARAKDNKEVFSQILADLIQADFHRPVNVINGGVQGFTMGQIGKLTSGIVIPLQPSMIIIYTGFNDIAGICKAEVAQRSQPWRPPMFGLPRWVMSREMIRKNTTFLRRQPLHTSNLVDPKDVDLSSHRIELEKMVSDIREHGIEPVLVTNARSYINVPKEKQAALAAGSLFYYSCLNLEGVIEVGEMYNQLIKNVAAEYNAQLIDLGAVMPGGKDYFVDGGHFTLTGEKYVARTVYEAIKQKLPQ
jgi:lysophospholipase L1-like esterase